jgi:hypothetical protein
MVGAPGGPSAASEVRTQSVELPARGIHGKTYARCGAGAEWQAACLWAWESENTSVDTATLADLLRSHPWTLFGGHGVAAPGFNCPRNGDKTAGSMLLGADILAASGAMGCVDS